MEAAHTVNPWVALAYLVAGVCFILALRGLSSPATSRTGNRFGMVGMMIAVVTTLMTHFPMSQRNRRRRARWTSIIDLAAPRSKSSPPSPSARSSAW